MISIQSRQRTISYNKERITSFIEELLDLLGYKEFDIGVLLTTNKTIRQYNKQYRNKDAPTDILSFSYHPNLVPGKRIKVMNEEDKNLGDLIISLEYVQKDAAQRKTSLEERLKVLIIHGICHLLGYDHETDKEWRSMRAKEAYLFRHVGQKSL